MAGKTFLEFLQDIDTEAKKYFECTVTPTAYGRASGGGNTLTWRPEKGSEVTNFNVPQLLYEKAVDAFKYQKNLKIVTEEEGVWKTTVWAIVMDINSNI